MYRILMPIDTSEERVTAQTTAILELADIAEEVEVTIVHVFSDRDQAESTSPTQLSVGQEAYDRLTAGGIAVESVSRSGEPAEVILNTAREIGANQIVLGGRKRSTLGSLVFGSVSQDVTLNATQPVTITGSVEDLERPSHRCAHCGETYYATVETDIRECRNCGGVNVERITDEGPETQ